MREDRYAFDRASPLRTALDLVPALREPAEEVRRGQYGDVLEWKYIQELSVDEIAGRLGVGYKAAESLLTRARAAFRDGFPFVTGDWLDGRAPTHPRTSEGS